MSVRTLGDFMKTAGLKFDEPKEPATPAPAKEASAPAAAPAPAVAPAPAPAAAPAAAAPAKTAEGGESSQPTTEPAGGHDPRDKRTDGEAQDTGKSASVEPAKIAAGQVQYDPEIIKTAAQQWCLDQGVLVADEKIAQSLYDDAISRAEQAKSAEAAQKHAALERQGIAMYHGMLKESAAYQLAAGEIDLQGAAKTAAAIGADVNQIVAHARELKQAMTDVEIAAVPNDVFFAGQQGMAARSSSSETLGGAAQNGNTTEFTPAATAGTRQPAHGPDENTRGMVDVVTLPGNPGLNHAQAVDQGKGSSGE